jgi:transcriptional regulator with XRE-family HTH domain
MRKDVQARIRRRIRDRLDELGMTARELARSVGHDDAWISGILKGAQGLHWKDFDAVADKLRMSPSELVRHDDDVVRELAPHEMRFLGHYQLLPRAVQAHWTALLDHYAATVPDRDTAALLDRLRVTPKSVRRPVLSWLERLLEEGIPPEAVTGGLALTIADTASEPNTRLPAGRAGRESATRLRRGGPRRLVAMRDDE